MTLSLSTNVVLDDLVSSQKVRLMLARRPAGSRNYLYNSRGEENVESNLALSLSWARTWLEQENGGLRGAAGKWHLP